MSIICVTVAFGLFVAGARAAGWTGADGVRWVALAVAYLAWLAVLLPWYRRAGDWAPSRHQRACTWHSGHGR